MRHKASTFLFFVHSPQLALVKPHTNRDIHRNKKSSSSNSIGSIAFASRLSKVRSCSPLAVAKSLDSIHMTTSPPTLPFDTTYIAQTLIPLSKMPSLLIKTVGFVLLALVGSFLFGLLNDLDVFKPLPAPSLGGEIRGGATTTTTPPGFVCQTLARDTVIGKKGNWCGKKKGERDGMGEGGSTSWSTRHGKSSLHPRVPPFHSSMIGAEDIVTITPSILLTGTDDRLRLWENARFGPPKTPQAGREGGREEERE